MKRVNDETSVFYDGVAKSVVIFQGHMIDYVIGPLETQADAFEAAGERCRRLGWISPIEGVTMRLQRRWLEPLQSYGAAISVVLGGLMFVWLVQ